MRKQYVIDESDMKIIQRNIEEIDIVIGEIICRGFPNKPDGYKDYILEKLGLMTKLNSTVGKLLEIWE